MKTQTRLIIFALGVFFFSSCKKSETNDGIASSDSFVNHSPVGYKFPAKFEGWSTLTSIDVYEKGKKIKAPKNAKEIYFPITLNIDPIPNYNIPEDYKDEVYIFNKDKIGLFGNPTNFKCRNGIFSIFILQMPINDSTFMPIYVDYYGGDFYHLTNYRYYLNVDGHRMQLFSCIPLSYNQIISNYSDKMYTSFEKENIRNVAIATISLNLNLVTNQ